MSCLDKHYVICILLVRIGSDLLYVTRPCDLRLNILILHNLLSRWEILSISLIHLPLDINIINVILISIQKNFLDGNITSKLDQSDTILFNTAFLVLSLYVGSVLSNDDISEEFEFEVTSLYR